MAKTRRKTRFAICTANEGCDDLEVRRVYRLLDDDAAAREGFVRIVDDSGEDYLYPSRRFVIVEFPPSVEKQILAIPLASGAQA